MNKTVHVRAIVKPDMDKHRKYLTMQEKFRSLYQALRAEFTPRE